MGFIVSYLLAGCADERKSYSGVSCAQPSDDVTGLFSCRSSCFFRRRQRTDADWCGVHLLLVRRRLSVLTWSCDNDRSASARSLQASMIVTRLSYQIELICHKKTGSGALGGKLGILPFMAKWALGRVGRRRGDDGRWTGLYSCRMLRATQWITWAQRSEQKSIYSRYPKSRADLKGLVVLFSSQQASLRRSVSRLPLVSISDIYKTLGRHFYLDSETTAQCELFQLRRLEIFLRTYLFTECAMKLVRRKQWKTLT